MNDDFRMTEVERRCGRLEERLNGINVALINERVKDTRQQMQDLRDDMQEVVADVKGLRKALTSFALTIAASAVAFAITVFIGLH